ncbi:DUF3653 domain-containing protein [Pseudomonadota bacterium]
MILVFSHIDEYRCVIVTTEGRRFSPKELDSWVLRFDEYHALNGCMSWIMCRYVLTWSRRYRSVVAGLKNNKVTRSPKRKRRLTVRLAKRLP